ncbi:MAG TPA: MFS transporter [Chthoniobacterales bacterium]|nr:MFS transporter [Chthoniobacterales bacterium]
MSATNGTQTLITTTVTPEGRHALWGAAIGYAMDGFDLLILGFMLRQIGHDLNLNAAQAASLVTVTLIGAVIGGLVFGLLSDRLGRVRVLTWTIVVFAVFTGLCTFARGYWDLLIYRFLAGLGLGGEFGIGMALAAEAWPAAKRAQASSYVGLGWQFGVLAAALVTPALLPIIGWRGMFVLGLFPAAIAYVIRRRLHEPELFITRALHQPPLLTRLRMLTKDRPTAQVTLAMAILCSVQNFGYYGVMIWLPNYLGERFGYSLTQSAIWTAVTVAGMIAGIWIFGRIADHVGRRPAFIIYMLGAAILVVLYSRLTDAIALLVTGAAMGFFVNGMLGGYGALMSELYPTQVRATAQNVLFNLGRAVGGLGPVTVGAVTLCWGFPAAIGVLALLYLLDLIVLLLFIPEKRGADLG